VIARFFHRWERRLASADSNRVVRPFDWGLDWLGVEAHGDPAHQARTWVHVAMADTDRFFEAPATDEYEVEGEWLRFPSALQTPHARNNIVHCRLFHGRRGSRGPRRAVLVLPQWNADESGHVALCNALASFGLTALRLSLPYHDARRPADLERADYIVSANVGRTVQVNRQAVLDARRAVHWLERQGFDRIGILGTSLGSCLAMLTMTHDRRITAGAFNHVSPFFADVVWRGLSTGHVRAAFDGHITLDALREYWMPISPWPFIDRIAGRPVLLVYARYDLTFPLDLSRLVLDEFTRRGVPHTVAALPCGHYTTGATPFKYLDGYYLTKFLLRNL
jgi:dienelactone hydrolase